MIILLSGKQRSGKNEVGRIICSKLPQLRCVGFADAVKDEYCSITGIAREEIEHLKNTQAEIRAELIALAENRKKADPGHWAKKLQGYDNIVVTDFRFRVEAELFPKAFKVRIYRDRGLRQGFGLLSNEESSSETELDDFDFDWYLGNCGGIDQLTDSVEYMLTLPPLTSKEE